MIDEHQRALMDAAVAWAELDAQRYPVAEQAAGPALDKLLDAAHRCRAALAANREGPETPDEQVVLVLDPGGLGFVIERLWAFLAVHDDGDEGVVAAPIGGGTMPLVAADHRRLEQLRPYAQAIAKAFGKPVRLVRFDRRVEVEVFEP